MFLSGLPVSQAFVQLTVMLDLFPVLASDYAGCLTSLMKFPQVSDAHYFIDKALWLREPSVSIDL